jgi:type I restriction enzyme S subunit
VSTLGANTPTGPWNTVALKHVVLSIQTGPFGSQLHAEDYSPGGRPVINPAHLRDGQIEPDSDSAVNDDTFGRLSQHELREGDVVIGRRGELGRCGVVTRDQAGWLCGTGSIRVRPDTCKLHSSWLRWLLAWTGVREWLTLKSVGSTMDNLGAETVGSMPIPVPPLRLQRLIADRLDRETARLDGLVAAKERVLRLVEEKRRALITRAVTRGLDPRAPLRDSGIPWLGEIPAHWETPPVYSRFEVQLGKMLDEKRIKGTHLAPYLRNVDVQWGTINATDLPEMDFDDEDRVKYSLRAGDILVCEGGEVGRCAIWDGAYDECYYQKALHRLRVVHGTDDPRFFILVMRTLVEAGVFSSQASASTIQHLPAEKLRVVRYPAPPLSEQRAIVAHISAQATKLDALRAVTERTITLLKERRAALIAAAVTGQIQVEGSV